MAPKHRRGRNRKRQQQADTVPVDHADDIIAGRGSQIIRRIVRSAARRCGLQAADVDDLVQTLTAHLLLREADFNAQRGTWSTFCTVVVDRKQKSILQQKRRSLVRRFVQLPDESEIQRDRLHPHRSDDPRSAAELALDVEERIQRLPPSLQEMCRRVQCSSVTEAARDMGIPRQTFVDRLRRLAPHFLPCTSKIPDLRP